MKKAYFYGDSNTFGYDPTFYAGGRYPCKSRWTTLLSEDLEGAWEVAADGMPGRMIPRPGKSTAMVLESVRSDMPLDLFAVMLGTNDLMSMREPDASQVAAKMDAFIGSAADSLLVKILLIAPPRIRFTDPSCTEPFVRGTKEYERKCLRESALLARHYERIAKRRGIFYADASAWDLALAFDGVHLTEEANRVFAKELAAVLGKIGAGPQQKD